MKDYAKAGLLSLGLFMTGCSSAGAGSCFIPETVLPKREAVLGHVRGQSQQQAIEAAFAGDASRLETMVRADPALGKLRGGDFGDLLSIAVARCDAGLLSRLLSLGLAADGPPGGPPPLLLALRATTPNLAELLLKAGASPNPKAAGDSRPLDEAILIGSAGAVRMLLDHGADVNRAGKLGERPLQVALDSHRFAIAELLLERGADPWAADASGGTLGASVAKASLAGNPADEQARKRLIERVKKLGWPAPPPDWRAVKQLRAEGRWPPRR